MLAGSLTLVDLDRKWLEVMDLTVAPALRGRGLGRLLLALAMERAFAMRKSHIRLVADDDGSGALRRWYRSLGYHPVGVDRRGRAILETALNRERLSVPEQYHLQGGRNAIR
jgi:ribosomal protein S18 acetylase RimI-like enzyme